MKLAITIPVTQSYAYALHSQARDIQANISYAGIDFKDVHLILITNKHWGPDCYDYYSELMPGINMHHVQIEIKDHNEKNYKESAAHTVYTLRMYGFAKARSLQVDFLWSLDSDVLIKANALKAMLWTLEFDNNWFGVASCAYQSNGGANNNFLFGYGNYTRHILPDYYPEERKVPKRYLDLKEKLEKELKTNKNSDRFTKIFKTLHWLDKRIEKYPPIDNVFGLSAKFGYKKRGWSENAMPGVTGICPVDWIGLGCCVISKKALDLVSGGHGYGLQGTDDLFIIYNYWRPNNIRIAAIPMIPSSHVIRNKENGQLRVLHSYLETEGECAGHLRTKIAPFYEFKSGESFTNSKS